MVADALLPRDFVLAAPVQALRQVSYDVTLAQALRLADGTTVTALDMQWELYERARKYADERGTDNVGGPGALAVLDRWESVLGALEDDPMKLSDQLDWVAKYHLVSAYRERHAIGWDDARLQAIDLQYHDLRPDKSLFRRLSMQRLVDDDAVKSATYDPPTDTRAYFRGECLRRWPDDIVAANWDSLVFDIGVEPLRRVPMMEPLRGTKAHVGALLESCTTAAELLERLSS